MRSVSIVIGGRYKDWIELDERQVGIVGSYSSTLFMFTRKQPVPKARLQSHFPFPSHSTAQAQHQIRLMTKRRRKKNRQKSRWSPRWSQTQRQKW